MRKPRWAACGLFLCSMTVFAGSFVPDAGQLMNQVAPSDLVPVPKTGRSVLAPIQDNAPMRQFDQTPFRVNHIRLLGNRAINNKDLEPIFQSSEGKDMTLGDLWFLAGRITRYYHDHGYLLARAYVPAQDVSQGDVVIQVLEGRFDKLYVKNSSHVRSSVLDWFMQPLYTKSAIKKQELEQQLYLMNDLPGVVAHGLIRPGSETGTSDFLTFADSTPRFKGNVGVDDWGNRYTGALRAYTQLDLLSPLRIGDHLSAYLMDSEFGGSKYGRVSYDVPVNGEGMRVGAAYGDLTYALGKEFTSLHAHGTASSASVYLMQPLIRDQYNNLNIQLVYDSRYLNDVQTPLQTVTDHKRLDVFSEAFNGDHQGLNGSMTSYSMTVSGGSLALDALTNAQDAQTYHTQGLYLKMLSTANTLQPLRGRFSLYAALTTQFSDNNMDPEEKLSLGGPTGVRAYPQGEALVDQGALGTAELRYALREQMHLTLFYDAAVGNQYHSPLPTTANNRRTLSGVGFGLISQPWHGLSSNASVAWRTSSQPTSAPDARPTFWWQLQESF